MYVVRKVGKKKRKKEKETDFKNLDSFRDSLNRVGKIYNVRHTWTVKKLVRLVKEFTGGDSNGRMLYK